MTTMGLQKRLILGFLTISSLLCIYILCVNLEIPWWMVEMEPVHKFTQSSNSSKDSKEATGSSTEQWTQTTPTSAFLRDTRNSSHASHVPKLNIHKEDQPVKIHTPPSPVRKSKSSLEGKVRTEAPAQQITRTTEPPFIGDSYAREDILPQTDCPNSIRGRITQTDFAKLFLGNIPVLQWAKHATMEQYKHLSHYPGAHGWALIDFQTLVGALSVLNSSANWQMLDNWKHRKSSSQCTRCAVVGNGGILKNSTKGKEIDAHDYVFRTNGAIIMGFEQDVGSRTTHYTFSTNTLMNSMRNYAGLGYKGPPVSEETRYVFLPDHDRDYLLMKAAATHTAVERGPERNIIYFGKDVSAEKLKMYHPDFIRYLRNRFLRANALKTKYKDIYRPSTGAVMLLAALHTCDQVSAYGFMTPDYKNYSDHYYDKQFHPVGFFINHDLRLEMNLWQRLHSVGLIQLYMRQIM